MDTKVDFIKFENGKVIKVGDKIIPKSEHHFKSVYGGAYGGGAYNSRPEIDYKFKNRLGRENEIVEIIHKGYLNSYETSYNDYSYLKFLLVLKTDRSRINMLISLNDCCIDDYLNND